MTIKYFAYGSNLDLPQMKRRCPSSKLISKGSLSDYRLTFNRFSSGWDGGVLIRNLLLISFLGIAKMGRIARITGMTSFRHNLQDSTIFFGYKL